MSEPAPLASRVFARLADGRFHSGQDLARQFAVSRSAIWKATRLLRELGTDIHAVRNRGYRLATPVEPLDGRKIRTLLTPVAGERVASLEVAWSVASTNTVLMERSNPPIGRSEVMLAEYQTAGRGRRGRPWFAPPGGAICLSTSWTFREVPRDLGALSLVMGVCALQAISGLGIAGVRLKWPNDLLIDDGKLGGVLIELRAESAGPACVVIGIGLNVALGTTLLAKIRGTGPNAVDLTTLTQAHPSRNTLAAALISGFVQGLCDFERDGLQSFIEVWREADALRGREVSVQTGNSSVRGTARGIDASGALMVQTAQGLQRFISGDVSVRAT